MCQKDEKRRTKIQLTPSRCLPLSKNTCATPRIAGQKWLLAEPVTTKRLVAVPVCDGAPRTSLKGPTIVCPSQASSSMMSARTIPAVDMFSHAILPKNRHLNAAPWKRRLRRTSLGIHLSPRRPVCTHARQTQMQTHSPAFDDDLQKDPVHGYVKTTHIASVFRRSSTLFVTTTYFSSYFTRPDEGFLAASSVASR